MKKMQYIKDLIAENTHRYLIGILCLMLVDAFQLVMPWVFKLITDALQAATLTQQQIVRYALIIGGLSAGIAVFRFLWRFLILGASRRIEAGLRERFYAHLQRLGATYYNNHKTGDLMTHATSDIGNITTAAGMGVIIAVDCALIPVVAIVMMINTAGWKLSLASFSPLLLLCLVMMYFLKEMQTRFQNMQEALSSLTETTRENFSGIRVVKAFVQEMKEMAKFEKANGRYRQTNMRLAILWSMMFPTIMSISALGFAIALWFGGIMVINREITLGDFVAFNSYLTMLVWPVAALGWVMNMMQRGSVSLQRVNEILDEKPEIASPENPAELSAISGKIEFRNLTFTYPGSEKPVLRNIDITVEKGKTLAIVGRTGSGKSTLIHLIPHLYNVPEGTVLIDGIDINRIPVEVLREAIGFVPQDTFLFSTTIRNNIDFFLGKEEKAIEDVAKTAMVYDNVMEFPHKFNTLVGERGVTLSGGQKQRIAIARALLRSPSILILDDSLSAVDTRTEEEILKGLKGIMRERTTVLVSHRISTIKEADEIIVLEDGTIAERGTHESLLELQGAYYNLYQKQLLAEQMEKEE